MILLKPYENLDDVLIHLKIQVRDSINYVKENIPKFHHPKSLFYYLKAKTIYQNDPETIELLMTAQTLLSGSHTGVKGGGDCDDFTILSLACLINSGFKDNYVVLCGRNKKIPVHIYVKTLYNNQLITFDLTNSLYNFERKNYKYYQQLKFEI